MGSCSFFCVFFTKKPPKFTSCHSLPLWKTPRPNIAVWWLSTPPKFDFNRLKPRNSLILRGFFQKVAEMSTDFPTSCGKLFGRDVEKSTGKGGVFHRGPASLRRVFSVGKRRVKRSLTTRLFFKKGLHFSRKYAIIMGYNFIPTRGTAG